MAIVGFAVAKEYSVVEAFPVAVVGFAVAKEYSVVKAFPVAVVGFVMEYSVVEAFPVAVVGFAVAKVYAVKHDYVIDGNQVRDCLRLRSLMKEIIIIYLVAHRLDTCGLWKHMHMGTCLRMLSLHFTHVKYDTTPDIAEYDF